MAGRPRLYADAAEKTRAYRQRREPRMVTTDRVALERLEEHLERLRKAVYVAQARGEALALSLKTVLWTDILEDLALYFESGVITPRPVRLLAKKKGKQPEK